VRGLTVRPLRAAGAARCAVARPAAACPAGRRGHPAFMGSRATPKWLRIVSVGRHAVCSTPACPWQREASICRRRL
jgi:hypothetical protein